MADTRPRWKLERIDPGSGSESRGDEAASRRGRWIRREEGVGKGRRNARPAGQRGAWEWEPKTRSWMGGAKEREGREEEEGG
jgi:hypothetical protein